MREPPGWRLRQFEAIESTSDLCVTLAQAGEPAGLAVLAARQTHGRGSRGRVWTTLPGNLALSALLRPGGGNAGHWALLAAVALADALEPSVRLKWPNDVMLDGRKLGGILLDAAWSPGGGVAWLVVGFGANLRAAPGLPGVTVLPGRLEALPTAHRVLEQLDHWAAVLGQDGFGPVRQAWLERGPALGELLRLTFEGTQVAGTFAGLGDDGALLLQSGGKVHAFATGRVLQVGE